MKKNFKIIFFVILACFFSNTIKAQSMQDSISVIISPGTDITKSINDVKLAVKNSSGINYIGYCSNHNIYLLYIDSHIYASDVVFYNHIKSISGVSTLLLKSGKVNDIQEFCSFSDPVDAGSVKAKYGH